MKKFSKAIKVSLILVTILANIATVSFAAWWGTPGYEWCFSKGITPIMTQNEMNQKVSLDDFYSILLRYLRHKGIYYYHYYDRKVPIIQTRGNVTEMNGTILGMMNDIDNYISRPSLSPNDYRKAITYMEHAEEIIQKQQNLLSRADVKSFNLYLSLAKYKAATLINVASFREQELDKYSNVKFVGILDYGIKPYYGDITRREFLILMFSLLSNQEISDEEKILEQYNDSGVLIGYNNDLMLDKNITYSEIFTFLYRFEAFEFNPVEEE